VGGYFGARLLSVVIEQPEIRGWQEILLSCFSLGPLTFYGGAIGGTLLVLCYAILRRLPVAKLCDIGIPPLLLALGIGRIGCFLNGDDYGRIVTLAAEQSAPWWAVKFASHGEEVYRYPVQLWESAAGFVLFFIAYSYRARLLRSTHAGLLGLNCVLAYCIVRFTLEFWRDDPRGWLFFPGLSTSQGISACVCGVVGLLLLKINVPQHRA
jgi:phosphatidylglycerol:prolipoprotein diacylglycerol transferase